MNMRRHEDAPLKAPNTDGNVWPKQLCPTFEPRSDAPLGVRQCWYCRYADFHLYTMRSLDVGVCYWPKKPEALRKKIEAVKEAQPVFVDYSISPIKKLSPEWVVQTVAKMTQVFENDPVFQFIFQSSKELARFLEICLLYYLKQGTVLGAYDEQGELRGISLWNTPGGSPVSVKSVLKSGMLGKFLGLLFHVRTGSFYRMLKLSDLTGKKHPEKEHAYLFLLAAFQPGAGGALLEEAFLNFGDCDSYLENSNPRANNAFYQKHGFELLPKIFWRACIIQPMARKSGETAAKYLQNNTAVQPHTGSRAFLTDELLELANAAGADLNAKTAQCPACGFKNPPASSGLSGGICQNCGLTLKT